MAESFTNPTNQLTFEPPYGPLVPGFRGLLAFPYVFPGAYSCPQVLNNGTAPYGWIHSPNPQAYVASTNSNVAFDPNNPPATNLLYLNTINHNPIDLGDNLPLPGCLHFDTQTWWGFPTWRETLSSVLDRPHRAGEPGPGPAVRPDTGRTANAVPWRMTRLQLR